MWFVCCLLASGAAEWLHSLYPYSITINVGMVELCTEKKETFRVQSVYYPNVKSANIHLNVWKREIVTGL